MIKSITGMNHIVVTNGYSSTPSINNYSNNTMVGMIRYNNSNLEVYDGTMWQIMPSVYPTIELSGAAANAINWAMAKMAEEAQMEKLAAEHPAVKIAYSNMQRAAEQLKATIILSKDEQPTS